jgi:Cu2+-exporting ATPase
VPACEHCRREIAAADALADAEGRRFCCAGCRDVNAFIRGEGLQEFYRRRTGAQAQPLLPAAPAPVDPGPFREIVREIGELREIDLYVEGVRCASCVWLLEQVLERTPGVDGARVGYVTHRARVRWDPARAGLEQILARIAATGHLPRPYHPGTAARERQAESRALLVRFGTAAFLSAQLMAYSLALYAGYFQGIDALSRRTFGALSCLLAAPVLLYAGAPFFRAAAAGLRTARFTMDSLVALGAGAAFVASVWGLARGGEVYFDTAAMIVTLVLLGRWLESRAKATAAASLEQLAELFPREAVRLADAGEGRRTRETVALDALRRGDRVEVRPGGVFPADGLVLEGESAADESLLTGESRPLSKAAGDRVIAGSLNAWGCLIVEIERLGPQTTLAGIVAAVEEAQSTRPPIQGLADRIVGWFVPAVLAAAVLTTSAHLAAGAGAERALLTGISVLVIACPCSLGLATPLAIVIFLDRAAARGVLVKSGGAAERAAAVTQAILDKTGTVTSGTIVLREVRVADPALDRGACLELAAALAGRSGHALGGALTVAAGGRPRAAVDGFAEHPGRGVVGTIAGRRVLLGSRAFMAENGIDPARTDGGAAPADAGLTAVYLGWDAEARALFLLSDGLRPEAADAVRELRHLGIRSTLVSGDGALATASVAQRAGIPEHVAEARPERKREIVENLQRAGETVLAVGDGINDAPALAAAAVGVAIGRGTDIARASADVVLLRPDLTLVPWLVGLSRGTFRIVRQNLFWAFFYNIAALPLAAAGALHPIVAAAAMSASSLFVVVNSQRVRTLAPERAAPRPVAVDPRGDRPAGPPAGGAIRSTGGP